MTPHVVVSVGPVVPVVAAMVGMHLPRGVGAPGGMTVSRDATVGRPTMHVVKLARIVECTTKSLRTRQEMWVWWYLEYEQSKEMWVWWYLEYQQSKEMWVWWYLEYQQSKEMWVWWYLEYQQSKEMWVWWYLQYQQSKEMWVWWYLEYQQSKGWIQLKKCGCGGICNISRVKKCG